MKKVAVLIPTFRPGNYLESCFFSLEKQTLSKELFCVYIALNGPQDPFEDSIFEFLSKMHINYNYVYINEAGVSNARNKLLDISNEEFIVFLDDDDQLSENYLKELLNITSKKEMGISNTYDFENSLDKIKTNFIGMTFDNLKDGECSKYKIRKYFSSPCAKMIHRSMVRDVRFDTNLANGEDSLFMATISNNISAIKKTSSDTCYFVYERAESASRKKLKKHVELKRVYYLLKKYSILFFTPGYDKIFILTRIFATVRSLSRAF